MKAQELRLGNIVCIDKYEKEPFEVVSITSDPFKQRSILEENDLVLHSLYGDRYFDEIDIFQDGEQRVYGIELTSEILSNSGFIKEDHGFTIQVGNNLDLVIDLQGEVTGYGLNWKDSACYQWKHINQVHQLQNLYFALTGEELTIKL